MTNVTITKDLLQSSPGGIHAKFVDLGDSGMKIYRDEYARDMQYRNQSKLHDLGLAVKCWGCFDFDGPDDERLYAFYTEKLDCFDNDYWEALGGFGNPEADEYYDEWQAYADELSHSLECNGISWEDGHAGNVGSDSDGNLYLIDCDFLDGCNIELESLGCAGKRWR